MIVVKEIVEQMVIKDPWIFLIKYGSLILDLLKSMPDLEQN